MPIYWDKTKLILLQKSIEQFDLFFKFSWIVFVILQPQYNLIALPGPNIFSQWPVLFYNKGLLAAFAVNYK